MNIKRLIIVGLTVIGFAVPCFTAEASDAHASPILDELPPDITIQWGESIYVQNKPQTAGQDTLTPRFLVLRFPTYCVMLETLTGRIVKANQDQHRELWNKCEAQEGAADAAAGSRGAKLDELITGALYYREAGVVAVDELKKIREELDTLAKASNETDSYQHDLDEEWMRLWEIATCGDAAGCYLEQVRNSDAVITQLAGLGTSGSSSLSLENPQAFTTVARPKGGSFSCGLVRR